MGATELLAWLALVVKMEQLFFKSLCHVYVASTPEQSIERDLTGMLRRFPFALGSSRTRPAFSCIRPHGSWLRRAVDRGVCKIWMAAAIAACSLLTSCQPGCLSLIFALVLLAGLCGQQPTMPKNKGNRHLPPPKLDS